MEVIEREAAERAIAQLVPSLTTPDGSGSLDEIIFCAQGMCADAIETIRELPNIEAVPVVRGRWIPKDTIARTPFTPNVNCSECGYGGFGSPYCPNCGARMDGGRP